MTSISHHIPQRTCIACRMVKPKRDLIRLVLISDSGVTVDPSGKKAGRGVYLCRDQECWKTGLKGGRLEHALRFSLSEDNRKQLIEYARTFAKESVSA